MIENEITAIIKNVRETKKNLKKKERPKKKQRYVEAKMKKTKPSFKFFAIAHHVW